MKYIVNLFDLLFIALVLAATGSIGVAIFSAFRGRRARALAILRRAVVCAAAYIGIVYLVAAFSKPVVLKVGDPQCSDDWCIAVESVKRAPTAAVINLRIFSVARRVAQRESRAKDVYLSDGQGRRFDPIASESTVPLNTLLQAGESMTAKRTFELPAGDHDLNLIVDRKPIFPICLIIDECDAFHKGAVVRIE